MKKGIAEGFETYGERKRLIKKVVESADFNSNDSRELFEGMLPIIRKVAESLARRPEDVDDLVQAGAEYVLKLLNDRQTKPIPYAKSQIKFYMRKQLENLVGEILVDVPEGLIEMEVPSTEDECIKRELFGQLAKAMGVEFDELEEIEEPYDWKMIHKARNRFSQIIFGRKLDDDEEEEKKEEEEGLMNEEEAKWFEFMSKLREARQIFNSALEIDKEYRKRDFETHEIFSMMQYRLDLAKRLAELGELLNANLRSNAKEALETFLRDVENDLADI
ncbi:hypothetical protein KKC94_04915 [Patescibacteria group bacterium]|nr:hypothetical protein [Patescibacteria group bacterium]